MSSYSSDVRSTQSEAIGGNATRDMSLSQIARYLWRPVPLGGSLPEDVWRNRHRFLLRLTWFHAAVIALSGPLLGYRWELSLEALFSNETALHTVGESLIVAFFAALAARTNTSRTFRATAVGFGLMSSSAVLVHLSGGYIEFHFHFFVMLAFLALYQDWIPYILAILYVGVHHGLVGGMWPEAVYNHAAAFNAPWTWAGIHAFFVLSASVGSVIAWRFNELAFARTKLILESAGEGIFGLDLEGRMTFINPAAARMLLLNVADGVGKKMEAIVCHTGFDGSPFAGGTSPLLVSLKDGAARQGMNEIFRRKDGTRLPIDYQCAPIIERGQLVGVVVTFSDVSARRKAEEAIHKLNQELEQRVIERTAQLAAANKVKDEFLSVMSHELRTPLTVMMGYTGMIREGLLGEINSQQENALEKVITQARDQLTMITDLLQVSQMEERGTKVNLQEFRLRKFLEDLRSNYEVPLGKEVNLVWDYPSDLPVVKTDQVKLKHILENLINNAIKFTDEGSVTVSARLIVGGGKQAAEDRLEFKVVDTGIGIPIDVIPVIFERFHQGDSSETRLHGGVGLGLHIVKEFTELLGGRIHVESEPGKGSSFAVTIPIDPNSAGRVT